MNFIMRKYVHRILHNILKNFTFFLKLTFLINFLIFYKIILQLFLMKKFSIYFFNYSSGVCNKEQYETSEPHKPIGNAKNNLICGVRI